jgi:beta-lactamase superfamily II metal-dependent hydrolase
LLSAVPASAEMTVHFVDVGRGGGAFLKKDGKHIAYDCGDTFAADMFTGYLEALDVTRRSRSTLWSRLCLSIRRI